MYFVSVVSTPISFPPLVRMAWLIKWFVNLNLTITLWDACHQFRLEKIVFLSYAHQRRRKRKRVGAVDGTSQKLYT